MTTMVASAHGGGRWGWGSYPIGAMVLVVYG